jgi:hypothetical protein
MTTAIIPQTVKGAAQFGVGMVYIPGIQPATGTNLPRSRSVTQLENDLKTSLRLAADLRSRIYAPSLDVEKSDTKELQHELDWRLFYADYAARTLLPRIHNYPVLSAEPLTWRDEEGFPKLILLPIDRSGEVTITATSRGWDYQPIGASRDADYRDIFNEIIIRCYGDVGALLMKRVPYSGSISIKTSLAGLLMPKKTHRRISAARAHFGNQLFLIAEAPQPWEVNVVVPPKPDPLVVGYDNGLLFLVDKFNLTRLERVTAAEYTLG